MRTTKRWQIKTISLVLLLVAVTNLAACGGSADMKALVGTWRYDQPYGNSTTMTFNADGSWTRDLGYENNTRFIHYTGKFILDDDEKTITIEIDPLPNDLQFTTEVYYHYLLVGDSLTLSGHFDTAETAETYKKIS